MRKVCGVGFSDLDYNVHRKYTDSDGRVVVKVCPYYSRWRSMITRCYGGRASAYDDVFVCEEWLYASNFVNWMKGQYWEGLELDKDILAPGNKEYSPETARFVPDYLNSLLVTSKAKRGRWPLGVYHYPKTVGMTGTLSKPFQAKLWVANKRKYLGMYSDPCSAHREWQIAKVNSIQLQLNRYRNEVFYLEEIDRSLSDRAEEIRKDYLAGRETLTV